MTAGGFGTGGEAPKAKQPLAVLAARWRLPDRPAQIACGCNACVTTPLGDSLVAPPGRC